MNSSEAIEKEVLHYLKLSHLCSVAPNVLYYHV